MTFPKKRKKRKKKKGKTLPFQTYIDKKTAKQNENGDRRVNFKYFPPFQLKLRTYLSRRSATHPSTPFQPSLEFPFSLQLHRVTQTRGQSMERGEESLTFLRRSPRRWKSRSDRMESSSLSGESSGQPVLSVPAASSRTTFYYLLVLSSRGGLPANVSLSEIFRWETSRYTSLRIWTRRFLPSCNIFL